MTPETLPLYAQLGIAAVFLILLAVVYKDSKAERSKMLDKLEAAYDRIKTIEEATTGEISPTLRKRPVE